MKRVGVLAVVLAVAFGGVDALAQEMMEKEALLWAAEDIKWEAMKGGPPGVMAAALWGDMKKGAYGSLVKLPAGFDTPLHSHTHDLKLVIISGTMVHIEGTKEKKFGQGSYLFVPGGDIHITRVTADAPCVLFQESPGMFDLKPVDKMK